ncbi:MAG: ribbon-helix-helix domain-containing protein [Chloroflexi bacterium]|nr:ribbon-helix-helix domain-containing protein [Chloroflexota bacterium]
MKRTTIMIEEELLYDLKQIAQQQGISTSSVIREALAAYVTEQHEEAPPENPLLSIIALGASEEMIDLSNGKDEEILMNDIHPLYGWSSTRDSDT